MIIENIWILIYKKNSWIMPRIMVTRKCADAVRFLLSHRLDTRLPQTVWDIRIFKAPILSVPTEPVRHYMTLYDILAVLVDLALTKMYSMISITTIKLRLRIKDTKSDHFSIFWKVAEYVQLLLLDL